METGPRAAPGRCTEPTPVGTFNTHWYALARTVIERIEGRSPHPCLARRCGHPTDSHVRTAELDSAGETVVWCTHCRRHEVRPARRIWGGRRAQLRVGSALPFRAV